jgi:hypothetical protein
MMAGDRKDRLDSVLATTRVALLSNNNGGRQWRFVAAATSRLAARRNSTRTVVGTVDTARSIAMENGKKNQAGKAGKTADADLL